MGAGASSAIEIGVVAASQDDLNGAISDIPADLQLKLKAALGATVRALLARLLTAWRTSVRATRAVASMASVRHASALTANAVSSMVEGVSFFSEPVLRDFHFLLT